MGMVWAKFGQATGAVFYHTEYAYCFLTFPSRAVATQALLDLSAASQKVKLEE